MRRWTRRKPIRRTIPNSNQFGQWGRSSRESVRHQSTRCSSPLLRLFLPILVGADASTPFSAAIPNRVPWMPHGSRELQSADLCNGGTTTTNDFAIRQRRRVTITITAYRNLTGTARYLRPRKSSATLRRFWAWDGCSVMR